MNLIEKLGGYEKAKNKFRDNGSFHSDRIKSALLQYRRENNIFEVGDLVVYKHHIAPEIAELQIVQSLNESSCFILRNGMDYRAFYSDICHANPEEIKAGHRL